MYKLLLPLIVIIIAASSCGKNIENSCPPVTVVAPDTQVAVLQHYIDSSGIVAVKDPRGFFYSIADSGSGTAPTPCSLITINYKGKLLNGTDFDAGHDSQFLLGQLINGWQEGVPLIRKGGHITLYLPPYLGYGAAVSTTIPSNSHLIFDIELVGVQ
jgi:FKBP-type peptidyl-prolyl cis-trans isomerase FkpA